MAIVVSTAAASFERCGSLDALDDDAATTALARVPFLGHGAVRCVCRRLRRLVDSPGFRRERRAWGVERAVVFAGGRLNHDDARKSTLAWGAVARGAWRSVAAMPEGRAAAAVGAVGGDVVVAGGLARGDPGSRRAEAITAEVLAYAVAGDAWRRLAPLPERRFSAAGAAVGDAFFVVGGSCDGVSVTGRVDVYDVATNTWARAAPLPVAAMTAACGVVGDTVVVAGGCRDTDVALDACQIFDVAAGTWRLGPPMPQAVDDAAHCVYGGELFVVGGVDARGGRLATVFRFDGARWRRGPDLPHAVAGASAAVHGGAILLFHAARPGDAAAGGHLAFAGGAWESRGDLGLPGPARQLALPIVCANVLLG